MAKGSQSSADCGCTQPRLPSEMIPNSVPQATPVCQSRRVKFSKRLGINSKSHWDWNCDNSRFNFNLLKDIEQFCGKKGRRSCCITASSFHSSFRLIPRHSVVVVGAVLTWSGINHKGVEVSLGWLRFAKKSGCEGLNRYARDPATCMTFPSKWDAGKQGITHTQIPELVFWKHYICRRLSTMLVNSCHNLILDGVFHVSTSTIPTCPNDKIQVTCCALRNNSAPVWGAMPLKSLVSQRQTWQKLYKKCVICLSR